MGALTASELFAFLFQTPVGLSIVTTVGGLLLHGVGMQVPALSGLLNMIAGLLGKLPTTGGVTPVVPGGNVTPVTPINTGHPAFDALLNLFAQLTGQPKTSATVQDLAAANVHLTASQIAAKYPTGSVSPK